TDTARLFVENVQKGPHGEHIHTVRVEQGVVRKGELVLAQIDPKKRKDIVKNHTATHLLHQALRETLGEHVSQAGSLVADERLRFDFTHVEPMSEEELIQVEQKVNQQIWSQLPVEAMIKSLEEAKAMGAMALF